MSLAADYIETPMYIPPYRPMSRSNEISQGNTEWMKMLHRVDLVPYLKEKTTKNNQDAPPQKQPPPQQQLSQPNTQLDINLKDQSNTQEPSKQPAPQNPHIVPPAQPRVQQVPGAKLPLIYPPAGIVTKHAAPTTPFRPFKDECRTDEYYKRYIQLSGNLAYRYPEPGYPRERQGAMGGTWRHIKEVNGYTGNQVCFVDGLVRLYDHDFKRQPSPSKQLPHMRQMMGTPAYAPNRHNITSYGKTLQNEMEKSAYKPWAPDTSRSQPNGSAAAKYKSYSYSNQ